MAEKTVELHKDLNLFSPLPAEVEEKVKDVTAMEKTVEVDVSFFKFLIDDFPLQQETRGGHFLEVLSMGLYHSAVLIS